MPTSNESTRCLSDADLVRLFLKYGTGIGCYFESNENANSLETAHGTGSQVMVLHSGGKHQSTPPCLNLLGLLMAGALFLVAQAVLIGAWTFIWQVCRRFNQFNLLPAIFSVKGKMADETNVHWWKGSLNSILFRRYFAITCECALFPMMSFCLEIEKLTRKLQLSLKLISSTALCSVEIKSRLIFLKMIQ